MKDLLELVDKINLRGDVIDMTSLRHQVPFSKIPAFNGEGVINCPGDPSYCTDNCVGGGNYCTDP